MAAAPAEEKEQKLEKVVLEKNPQVFFDVTIGIS
jgi:hypothetical protein